MTRGVDSLSTEVKVPPFLFFSFLFLAGWTLLKGGKISLMKKKGSAAVNEMSWWCSGSAAVDTVASQA